MGRTYYCSWERKRDRNHKGPTLPTDENVIYQAFSIIRSDGEFRSKNLYEAIGEKDGSCWSDLTVHPADEVSDQSLSCGSLMKQLNYYHRVSDVAM